MDYHPFLSFAFLKKAMANFSYLFLSNTEPWRRGSTETPPMRHISTGRHAIPFAFKVLLSGDPKAIKSPRGEPRTRFKLIGDRQSGVERLTAFLKRLDAPHAQPVIDHTLAFLNRAEHKSDFFVLDPVEVFDLTEESHAKQVQTLIDEITDIGSTFEHELARLQEHLGPVTIGPGVKPGFIAGLFGAKRRPAMQIPFPEPLYRFEQAGLRNWHERDECRGDCISFLE